MPAGGQPLAQMGSDDEATDADAAGVFVGACCADCDIDFRWITSFCLVWLVEEDDVFDDALSEEGVPGVLSLASTGAFLEALRNFLGTCNELIVFAHEIQHDGPLSVVHCKPMFSFVKLSHRGCNKCFGGVVDIASLWGIMRIEACIVQGRR